MGQGYRFHALRPLWPLELAEEGLDLLAPFLHPDELGPEAGPVDPA